MTGRVADHDLPVLVWASSDTLAVAQMVEEGSLYVTNESKDGNDLALTSHAQAMAIINALREELQMLRQSQASKVGS